MKRRFVHVALALLYPARFYVFLTDGKERK